MVVLNERFRISTIQTQDILSRQRDMAVEYYSNSQDNREYSST